MSLSDDLRAHARRLGKWGDPAVAILLDAAEAMDRSAPLALIQQPGSEGCLQPSPPPGPPMPARPPANALKAIETVRGLRSWTAAEMYAAVREACADPAPPAEPPRARPGAPPVQG